MRTAAQPSFNSIPALPGTYALMLDVTYSQRLTIGRFGTFQFEPGVYVYVGSAHGPGGLAARLRRHLQFNETKRIHWHIDWLLTNAHPTGAIWSTAVSSIECAWAEILPGIRQPRGFGASDCGCPGHLVRLPSFENRSQSLANLAKLFHQEAQINLINGSRSKPNRITLIEIK
jgi:Uri superfamily endonuclease